MSNDIENNEIILSGAPGSSGIAIGEVSLYERKNPKVSSENIEDRDIEDQIGQFKKALERAEGELQKLLEEQEDGNAVELINLQIEMIKDPDLCSRVEAEICENNQQADSAIHLVFEEYLAVMKQNQDDMQQDRSVDIMDIRDLLIQIVNDRSSKAEVEEGTILVAELLSPREVIEFFGHNIKGIIMDHGGTTSHAAIIARSMNIPAVVGLKKAAKIIDGSQEVILDGNKGEVIVNPRSATKQKYQKLIKQQLRDREELEVICIEPNRTNDNHSFTLRANIEFIEELDSVEKYRAEGIGLLRTESIYLRRGHFDDQQKQESFFETILESTEPHPVTIRLFDAGGDKFFNLGQKEQNPFLGWRGIRMLLDEKELLKNQLKCILKVAGHQPGRLRILAPMITTIDEVLQIKEMISELQDELHGDGNPIDEQIPFGIMVEVPGVALQAEAFARHTDFLSIGTNDLTQYILAVDRGNELISELYDQRHPAIWKLIKKVSEAAQNVNKPLSVCGELASNPVAACCLMGLGIKELSMSPSFLPAVKRTLKLHSLKEMQQLASNVLESETMGAINQIFNNWE